MIKHRLFFLTLCLVTVLLIVACSSTSVTEEPVVVLPPTASANDSVVVTETTVPNVEATQIPAVQPVATSRGDNLEATDPSTVSLASGQLQLVEFFRFT
jgi:ABC-type tungstate transport system permease subunit